MALVTLCYMYVGRGADACSVVDGINKCLCCTGSCAEGLKFNKLLNDVKLPYNDMYVSVLQSIKMP